MNREEFSKQREKRFNEIKKKLPDRISEITTDEIIVLMKDYASVLTENFYLYDKIAKLEKHKEVEENS